MQVAFGAGGAGGAELRGCGGTLKEKLWQPAVAQHSAMQSAMLALAGSGTAAKSEPQRISAGSSIDVEHTTAGAGRGDDSRSNAASLRARDFV